MPKILADRIVWDQSDFASGLADDFGSSNFCKLGNGAAYAQAVDPFRFPGAIVPAYNPSDVVSASYSANVDAILRNGVADYVGARYDAYISGGSRLHRFSLSADSFTNGSGFPHQPTATATVYDVLISRSAVSTGSNTPVVLYTWYNNTEGDIGQLTPPSAFVDNFGSTLPEGAAHLDKGVPLIFNEGSLGIHYITNGRYVASYDTLAGEDGTLNDKAFDLSPGWIAADIKSYDKYLAIFCYKKPTLLSSTYYRGEARCILWNKIDAKAAAIYELNDNYVSAGFVWNGMLGCFTTGRKKASDANPKYTAIQLFDGTKFNVVKSFSETPPIPGGIEIAEGMMHFVAGHIIYAFDGKNLHPRGYTTGTSNGLCRNFQANKLYASSGAGTYQGMEVHSANYLNSATWKGIVAVPEFSPGQMGLFYKARITFESPVSGGRSLLLGVQVNNPAGSYTTVLSGIVTTTDHLTAESATSRHLVSMIHQDTSGNDLFLRFANIRPIVIWQTGSGATAAPAVEKIELFFREVPATA